MSDIVAQGLRQVGPRTITDGAVLRAELEKIRTGGIAYEKEESGTNVACAASAIMASTAGSGAGAGAVAAVSVSGWSGRFDVARIGPAVRLAALGIARVLDRRTSISARDHQVETGEVQS